MAQVSDCCGAYSEYAGDICPECLEHCGFYDDEEENDDSGDDDDYPCDIVNEF